MNASPFARGQRARPLVYGHRGTRRGAPENTLLALRRALAQGADGVELDVRLCGSGEVVVVHDPDLRRVAGADAVVADLPLAELVRHDLGAGERVPVLEDALELVLGAGRLLNVEIKPDVPDSTALVRAVIAALRARSVDERARVLVSSFSAAICEQVRDAASELAVAFLYEREEPQVPAGMAAVHPHHALVDAAAVARDRGLLRVVNVWTVNDAERAVALAEAGVDGIITDDVPLVLGALAAAAAP